MSERTRWFFRSVFSFLLGWIIGAAAGIVTGLLLAPRSGAETQDQLLRQAEWMREEADRAIEEVKRKAEGQVAEARSAISERLKQGATMVEPEGQS